MKKVRIESIKISGIKNVDNGEITLSLPNIYGGSFLGLYGQNGTGKTAVIDSLEILEYVLSGKTVPPDFISCINLYKDYAKLSFKFNCDIDDYKFDVWYDFCIKKEANESPVENLDNTEEKHKYKIIVFDEVLSYSDANVRKNVLITTKDTENYKPESKVNEICGNDRNCNTELYALRKLSENNSQSSIFNIKFLDFVERHSGNIEYFNILNHLYLYGNTGLFVINTFESGLIRLDALALPFSYRKDNDISYGKLYLKLGESFIVSNEAYSMLKKLFTIVNTVLHEIIPGLTIDIVQQGGSILKSGKEGCRVQVFSVRNGKRLPLMCESDGIKRLISFIQLLIVSYNNPFCTLVIDEIDSGIFEYLLGELLKIVTTEGKGQMIFTSHNLRPLETIEKKYIWFTTTNPDNRYIHITNVKSNHNLRNLYYRGIVVGGHREELYDPTNNQHISFAFKEAGIDG